MAIGQFDILDAYWVAGTNPTTQVFSSAAGVEGFVANNAAAYQTWLAAGNFGTLRAITAESAGTAGVVRLTLDASQLQTGQRAQIAGLTGSPLANGFRQFNLIDATHIDLVGTTFVATASPTAATLAMAAILATDAALWVTFDTYAQQAFQQGALLTSTSVDLTLSSPLKALSIVTESGVSKKVILPNMRSPRAPPIGYTFSVKNGDSSTQSFTLYKADGTTVVRVLDPTDRLNLVLTDNSTTIGSFEVDPPSTGLTYTRWIIDTSFAVASTVGTITAVDANKRMHYKQIGKTVFLAGHFTITTNGTGAGEINVALPISALSTVNGGVWQCGGGFRGSDQKALRVKIAPASPGVVNLVLYDGTYPGADAVFHAFALTYECV